MGKSEGFAGGTLPLIKILFRIQKALGADKNGVP
jgi:hypothetical protein